MPVSKSQAHPPRRRFRQRFLLTLLGLVFAVSAVLRIGTLEFAWAADDPAQESAARAGPVSTDLIGVLQDGLAEVEEMRRDLDTRAAALAERESALMAAQMLVEERLAELEAAETRLAALIARSDQAAETDLERLTRLYETMPPETAAALFAQMPPSFAAGFIARMTPPAGAALMAAMTPEQAYAVSVVLATRNSSAPRLDRPETGASDTER